MAKVTETFSLDSEADKLIIDRLARLPKGRKSAAIRDALVAHFQGVTLADVYAELREINRKLEKGAVLSVASAGDAPADDEPPDVAAALDSLGL
jgi:hypothetical protein